jgi:SAM-dependent methyltransferase
MADEQSGNAWDVPHMGSMREEVNFHPNDFEWSILLPMAATVNRSPLHDVSTLSADKKEAAWSKHYVDRGIHFFPLKAYLFVEFPILDSRLYADPLDQIVLWDCGCGYGSATIPLMRRNPTWRFIATDSCQQAITMLQNALSESNVSCPLDCAVLDAASPGSASSILSPLTRSRPVDITLLVFVLSAMTRTDMESCVRNIGDVLVAGGHVCVRDYGYLDSRQQKFEQSSARIGQNSYMRKDGTIATFFSVEHLMSIFPPTEYECVECEYKTVKQENRKEKRDIYRVYIHGLFRKRKS